MACVRSPSWVSCFEHLDLPLPAMFRCGPLCVRFFFILTGYFITLSLWRVRGEMTDSDEGFLPLGRYYLARLLRTGPPFYLSLLLGAVFGIEEVRTNFLWLATFQANNYIAWLGYWPDAISHYWSLAVQEQFYFLWPLVVLTLPRRWFIPTMAAFIIFGLGFRIFLHHDQRWHDHALGHALRLYRFLRRGRACGFFERIENPGENVGSQRPCFSPCRLLPVPASTWAGH